MFINDLFYSLVTLTIDGYDIILLDGSVIILLLIRLTYMIYLSNNKLIYPPYFFIYVGISYYIFKLISPPILFSPTHT